MESICVFPTGGLVQKYRPCRTASGAGNGGRRGPQGQHSDRKDDAGGHGRTVFPERYSDHKSDFLQRGVRGSSQYTGGWNYKVKDGSEFVTQENREGEDDVRTYLFE